MFRLKQNVIRKKFPYSQPVCGFKIKVWFLFLKERKKIIVGSCFFIQSDNLCFWIRVFISFTLNETIHIFGIKLCLLIYVIPFSLCLSVPNCITFSGWRKLFILSYFEIISLTGGYIDSTERCCVLFTRGSPMNTSCIIAVQYQIWETVIRIMCVYTSTHLWLCTKHHN